MVRYRKIHDKNIEILLRKFFMALSQDDLFYCNMSTFHNWFTAERAPVCLCVCVWERVTVTLLNQINQSVTDVHSEAIVSQSDPLLLQTDAEHRFVGDGQLAPLLEPQDGHPARPEHGVLVPHQLHSGQIWWRRGGRVLKTLSYKLSKYLDYSINLFHYQGYFVFLNFSCIPIYLTYLWWVCWPWLAYGRRCPCCPPVGYRPL